MLSLGKLSAGLAHELNNPAAAIERASALLETSTPAILAADDVRANAMNRVAAAVGEGSMAIRFAHEYLATT